jgi:hypothetical protein
MWKPQYFTTLHATTAFNKDTFTFSSLQNEEQLTLAWICITLNFQGPSYIHALTHKNAGHDQIKSKFYFLLCDAFTTFSTVFLQNIPL